MRPSLAYHFQENNPEHLFLASKDSSYTYNSLQQFERFLVDFLNDFVLSTSRPLGIWAVSSDLVIFTIAACWKQNIPFVCLNPSEKAINLRKQVSILQPALILADRTKNIGLQKIKSTRTALLNLSEILQDNNSKSTAIKSQSLNHQDDAVFGYFFTSGTSSAPKIVPLKRRQMRVAADASAKNIKPSENHFWMHCMPLFHVGGVSLILRSLLYGSAIYRLDKFKSQEVALLLARDERFSAASLVPTMLKRLLDDPSFKTHAHFQAILLGGGPISPSLLKESVHRNITVIASFGMTETCAQIAANQINQEYTKATLKSAGTIFEPNKIEIRNDAGEKARVNEPGSIWLKGPQIFDGYLDKMQNKPVFDETGWFNTGDFGRLDGKNRLYIEARRNDLIITGGENVSPFEVENALEAQPQVKEAAVFGAPDEEWGQRVVAVIVAELNTNPRKSDLQRALKKKLAAFKIPKQFVFVDALPRTHTGKIQREKLLKLLP